MTRDQRFRYEMFIRVRDFGAARTSLFPEPRRRNLQLELSTARAFIEQAGDRQDQCISFGLPPTFLGDFRTKVNNLQQAMTGRLNSRTVRREASAGTRTALARGLEAVRDLDALVTIATRENPTTFAAWSAARRIEGQGSSSRAVKKAASTVAATGAEPASGPPLQQVLGRAS